MQNKLLHHYHLKARLQMEGEHNVRTEKMTTTDLQLFSVILLFPAVFGLYFAVDIRMSRQLLHRWAKQNQFRLSRVRLRVVTPKPLFMKSIRRSTCFDVTISEASGRFRDAWVACHPFGMWNPMVEVVWKDEQSSNQ